MENTRTPEGAVSGSALRREVLPRNIFWYVVLEAGCSTGFILGNWIFFWTRYVTFGQLGLIDGLAFGFGMFMEIPTGVLSDLMGRKRTLIAAMVCNVIGALLLATTNSLEQLVIGFLIMQIGWAFHSGAAEALAYDTLKEAGREAEYPRVLSRTNMIGTVVFMVTTLMGSGLYLIYFRLTHLVWALAFGVSLLASLMLVEPHIAHPVEHARHGNLMATGMARFRAQIREGVRQLRVPALRPYLLLIFVVLGLFTLYRDGIVQPSIGIRFGFDATAQSMITVISGLLSVAALALLPFLSRRVGERSGLLWIAFATGLGWLLAALPLGAWGIFVMLLIRLVGDFSGPWVSMIVNQHIESHARATALSAISLIRNVPYVLTALIAGQLIEGGLLWTFNLGLGLMAMAALVLSILAVPKPRANASVS